MPRFINCLSLGVLFGVISIARAEGPTPEIVDRLQAGTVYIETTMVLSARDWEAIPAESRKQIGRRPQGAASGSGFLISADGYVVTNAHVISDFVQRVPVGKPEEGKMLVLHFLPMGLKVVLQSGAEGERSFSPRIVKVDQASDLALLKIESPDPFQALKLNPEKIGAGQNIFLAGFPGGKLPDQAPFVGDLNQIKADKNPRVSINSGMVTAVRESGKAFRYQLDARANHGNSGGPVVNSDGEVTGVLYAGIDQMQSINYAIPTLYLKRVLPESLKIALHIPLAEGEATGPADETGSQSFKAFKDSGTFKLK